ncbi:hypothetical protein G2W53_033531 [Senna tora]|uniref:Pectinesterase inhibitor domain-containing protein n=1 Tax=Senna tora TaxID=362788 RepID=A0A834W730_9FABA|nr:hypothetical protein G2W53_033531 [Senna tora]
MTANPAQCEKILKGEDKKYMAQLPLGTIPKLSLEMTAAVTIRAVHYMNEKLATNHVELDEMPRIESCLDIYQEAMVSYNGAYVNFTMDPTTALKSLKEADVKIGSCESKLANGGGG